MSINHFKAELHEILDDWVVYKFFPDIIYHQADFGLFKININSLMKNNYEFAILEFPQEIEKIGEYRCKCAVAAISSKLKMILKEGADLPKEIFHIS